MESSSSSNDMKSQMSPSEKEKKAMSDDVKAFYNKTLSFFDNISCESNEKTTSKMNKNWKEERKMNVETFGVVQRQQHNNEMRNSPNYRYNNRSAPQSSRGYQQQSQQQQQQRGGNRQQQQRYGGNQQRVQSSQQSRSGAYQQDSYSNRRDGQMMENNGYRQNQQRRYGSTRA